MHVYATGSIADVAADNASAIPADPLEDVDTPESGLAGVGRLALTVYLTQTLMFTTLFYGYGFGQAFKLGPAAVTGWAVIIFAVQVVACQWWLQRFRFGPAEWLWRSLTYLKWLPLRLRSDSAP